MDEKTRRELLQGIDEQMKLARERKPGKETAQWYWDGVEDGLNKVYRFITTGSWET